MAQFVPRSAQRSGVTGLKIALAAVTPVAPKLLTVPRVLWPLPALMYEPMKKSAIFQGGEDRHGETSVIEYKKEQDRLFETVPNPFEATRYHSLVADKETIPDCLEITARAKDDGEIMGIRHKEYPIEGVQFHPESILTGEGRRILTNFLSLVKK